MEDIDLSDFNNKEIFELTCQNGHNSYIFVSQLKSSYTICKKCKSKIYLVICSGCNLEFDIPENNISIGDKEKLWKCKSCGQLNTLSAQAENNSEENYLKNDIPESVWKLQMSKPTRIDPSLLGVSKRTLNIIFTIILLIGFFLLAYIFYHLWAYSTFR